MKRILRPLGAMVFGIVCALIFAEIGARVLAAQGVIPSRMPADLFRTHAIGWTFQPNLNATIPSANGLIRVSFNRDGFRDERYAPARTDARRILVLGDSYVAALETPQENTFHTLLESASGSEVIAMGVSGYQITQEVLAYQEIGAAYQPDDVLLMLYIGNDLLGNMPREDAPYYTVNGEVLELHNYPWRGDFQIELVSGQRSTWIMKASELAFMVGILSPSAPPPTSDAPPAPSDTPTDTYYCDYLTIANYSTISDEHWAINEALLLALRDAAAADGATFRIAVIPTEFQVQPDYEAEFLEACPRPESFGAPPIQDHLHAFFEANDIPYLDLREAMIDARESTDQAMYLTGIDNHWTPAGHSAVADALKAWLEGD